MAYWLIKSEPDSFSIDDLAQVEQEPWDGVRNYQARNMLRDEMQLGDLAFFYHSNCKPPGIVGIAKVVSESYPDPTAFDPTEKYYDPKSDPSNPRWFVVDVALVDKFALISLETLKQCPALAELPLVKRGNRLSIMPVTEAQWLTIMELRKD